MRHRGFAALYITILIFAAILLIAMSVGLIVFGRQQVLQSERASREAYLLAEAGAEDALVRIMQGMNWSSPYSFPLGDGTVQVTISDIVAGERTIVAEGTAAGRTKKVEVIHDVDADEASFFFGAQVGDGGLLMQNGSRIVGNVFSNGNIQGNNAPEITGDASAAESSFIDGMVIGGDAEARTMSGVSVDGSAFASSGIADATIGGNAHADGLEDCTVGGNAFYQTIENCTVGGTQNPGSTPPNDVDPQAMPISDAKIAEWKQKAEDGGVINCSDEYEASDGEILGPVKITCDLKVSGQDEVTIAGFVWVEGDITLQNQAVLKLAGAFGSLSSAVVADDPADPTGKGIVKVQNSAQVRGSGDPDSYLMLVSMNAAAESGGGATALEVQNSSSSSIFYAPHGKIVIQNNVDLVEVTGYELELKNSAEVSYEEGLANTQFSSGPSSGWRVTSWREVE